MKDKWVRERIKALRSEIDEVKRTQDKAPFIYNCPQCKHDTLNTKVETTGNNAFFGTTAIYISGGSHVEEWERGAQYQCLICGCKWEWADTKMIRAQKIIKEKK